MTIDEVQRQIVDEMAQSQDWMERYTYLIGMGSKLEHGDSDIRRDDFQISGCQSQVWIRPEFRDGRLYFRGDSDAKLTRGIVALVLEVCNGRTPEEILNADLFVFRDTGLESNLSPARANGLASIINQIKEYARTY